MKMKVVDKGYKMTLKMMPCSLTFLIVKLFEKVDVTFRTWRGHQNHVMCLSDHTREKKKEYFCASINVKVAYALYYSWFWPIHTFTLVCNCFAFMLCSMNGKAKAVRLSIPYRTKHFWNLDLRCPLYLWPLSVSWWR